MYMNKHQRIVSRLTKINMKIYNISFIKAKRKASLELLGIRNMLINRYGFKRK